MYETYVSGLKSARYVGRNEVFPISHIYTSSLLEAMLLLHRIICSANFLQRCNVWSGGEK